MKCIFLEAEDGDNQNTEDIQLSLRKIEGAAFRGIRNGLDKVTSYQKMMIWLSFQYSDRVEEIARQSAELGCHFSWSCAGADRAVDGRPKTKESTTGGKLCKRTMCEREAKLEKYDRQG